MVPVYIIDDDNEVRRSLVMQFRVMGVEVRPFAEACDFLDEIPFLAPGVIFADFRMPNITGLQLLEQMRSRDCYWPTVMISGHADIGVAVRAMKLGAVEFLQKPFVEEDLAAAFNECAERLPGAMQRSLRAKAIKRSMATLSPREREVFEGVVSGLTSKEIGIKLGISPRTVESYRVTLMAKLGAQGLHDLISISSGNQLVL